MDHYVRGSAAISVSINGIALHKLWEVGNWRVMPVVESFELGSLNAGDHVLEIKNLPGYPTKYALQTLELKAK
jgi:hypothetical protein